MTPAIELTGLRFGFDPAHPILRDLNLALDSGERVVLTGPNGAGKTTLLHLLVGLLRPQAGDIRILGQALDHEEAIKAARKRTGLLFQDADDQLFCATVSEDVAFGPLNLGWDRDTIHGAVEESLAVLGIAHLKEAITYRLSGGEKRLAALAGLLAMRPDILLLDEPTNDLDPDARQRVLNLLAASSHTQLIISHDPDMAHHLRAKSVHLADGTLKGSALTS